MRSFLPFLAATATLIGSTASAQTFVNGSFETGDFFGYTTAGTPAVLMSPPTPVDGQYQALINSTGSGAPTGTVYSASNSVDAATLQAFLGTTLPNSDNGAPFNGEAIQQTFTAATKERITFSYSYQSREEPNNGFDGTGYVLNGTFHLLANSDTPGQTAGAAAGGFFEFGLPYTTATLTVNAGTNTLSFVAYNTVNGASPSGLFLDDITVTPLSFSIPGLTPNEQSVANYLDNNYDRLSVNFPKLFTALGAATSPAELASELNQLSPESLQIYRYIAFNNATFSTTDLTNHLANLRDGLTGFDGSQLVVDDPGLSPAASRINNRLQPADVPGSSSSLRPGGGHLRDPKDMDGDTKEMDEKAAQPLQFQESHRWSTFIAGDVVLADLSHDQDVEHENYTTGSVMAGADYRLDDHFTIGALLSYGHTDADLDHEGSSATVDTYSPGLFASYVDGAWYVNALAAYGYNSYTEDRHVSIGPVNGFNSGAPQGNQYTGDLTTGYEFHRGDWKFGPIAGLQYVNLGINAFSESGPTALNLHNQNDESLRSQVGVEGRYACRVGSIYLIPHASATWQHEFLDASRGITAGFVGSGASSFTVQGSSLDHDSALLDIGLNAGLTENLTLFTDYATEAGEDNYFAQSVQGGVRVGF
jgi:uncharacterized protein YhjY with autotransporter beta-barrel domain